MRTKPGRRQHSLTPAALAAIRAWRATDDPLGTLCAGLVLQAGTIDVRPRGSRSPSPPETTMRRVIDRVLP